MSLLSRCLIFALSVALVSLVACGSDETPEDKGPELLSAPKTHTPQKGCSLFTAQKDGKDIFPIVSSAEVSARADGSGIQVLLPQVAESDAVISCSEQKTCPAYWSCSFVGNQFKEGICEPQCGRPDQTATPIVVCGHLVFATHYKDCAGKSENPSKLWAVSLDDGTTRAIADNFDSESGVSFAKIGTTPYLVVSAISKLETQEGVLAWINLTDGSQVRDNPSGGRGNDSSGLWDADKGRYLFGTTNKPSWAESSKEPEYMGALFAVSGPGGAVVHKSQDDGIHGWFVGAPTTDANHIYIGLGGGHYGDASAYVKDGDQNFGNACSAVALAGGLKVKGRYDPGATGCVELKVTDTATTETSTTAELPIDKCGDAVWAQFRGPNQESSDDGKTVVVARLPLNTANWKPVCTFRVAINTDGSGSPVASAGYYQAPVIDSEGALWFTHNQTITGENPKGLQLWRVKREGCVGTLVASSDVLQGNAITSPMLAETKEGKPVVYVATHGTLHEFLLDATTWTPVAGGDGYKTYELSDSEFVSSPILDLQTGRVAVVSSEGGVHMIKTKAATYGSHIWPRMRRDNSGTAYNDDSCD